MSVNKEFEIVISKLPEDSTKANILHNYNTLQGAERAGYAEFVIDHYYKDFPDTSYLFYPALYKQEIDKIHERISYSKYDQVIRHGVKCKHCKGTNTDFKEQQVGGGDEYIPTRVTCHDCNKSYRT